MKVLGLCTHPVEAAATRYRLVQFIAPLAERGIELTVLPFLDKDQFESLYKSGGNLRKGVSLLKSAGRRLSESVRSKNYDAVMILREAMIFGPPFSEWLIKTIGRCPIILDLDDATYIRYVSPTYGRLGSALKFFGKTDKLIDWSEVVTCGNRHIANYVEKRNKKAVIIPTVVDTDKFCPIKKDSKSSPIIGWIGTHSTFPFLEALFPVFSKLAEKYKFTLKIVGSGTSKIQIENVEVENLKWSLEDEVDNFKSLDIGLYPMQTTNLINKHWLLGKSGFKAIQYMAVGIPYVVTPIGITAEIGVPDKTHFTAENNDQWYENLATLLESADLRKEMGKNGRDYSLKHFRVSKQAVIIASVISNTVEKFNQSM